MDCAEIRQGFLTGATLSSKAVAEHVRGCAECAELFANDGALARRLASVAQEFPASTAQLVALESALDAERGPRAFLRSRSTRSRWAIALALPLALMGVELGRGRVSAFGPAREAAVLLLLAFLSALLWITLRPQPIARLPARARSAVAAVAWCLPCLLLFSPETREGVEEFSGGFALRSLACFAYGSALAAPSFALVWALDRGPRVSFRVWALAAGTTALVANLILLLHCPVTSRAHLLAGHASIGVAWLLAVSATEWRRRQRV